MSDQTPEQLREEAKRLNQASRESFERSDTDGFLSQWASDITASKKRLEANLIEAGGVAEFPALFDNKGNLIADAREVHTRYGWAWVHGNSQWFNPSNARTAAKRRENNAKKGYYEGRVKAKARAEIVGSGTGLSGAANARPAIVPLKNRDGSMMITEVVDDGINVQKVDPVKAREACKTDVHDEHIENYGNCAWCGIRYSQVS